MRSVVSCGVNNCLSLKEIDFSLVNSILRRHYYLPRKELSYFTLPNSTLHFKWNIFISYFTWVSWFSSDAQLWNDDDVLLIVDYFSLYLTLLPQCIWFYYTIFPIHPGIIEEMLIEGIYCIYLAKHYNFHCIPHI